MYSYCLNFFGTKPFIACPVKNITKKVGVWILTRVALQPAGALVRAAWRLSSCTSKVEICSYLDNE